MYYYRIAATSEVLGAAHSAPQDADWIARYKAALSIVEPVEEFESASDPRPPLARKEPPPVVTTPVNPTVVQLIHKLSAATTWDAARIAIAGVMGAGGVPIIGDPTYPPEGDLPPVVGDPG